MSGTNKNLILRALDEAYGNEEAWFGPNLRSTLAALSLDDLTCDETYEGYSAWELALHCAYWKWWARTHITKEKDAFPYGLTDFTEPEKAGGMEAWKRDLAYLDEQHHLLKEALKALPEERLEEPWFGPDGKPQKDNLARHLMGVAFHDAYHTAQIRSMGLKTLRDPREKDSGSD